MKDKVILTDCDGVLLDWSYGFAQWMGRHGYEADDRYARDYAFMNRYGISKEESRRLVRMFNESATIRKLSPLKDAIKYVRKLHEEHGYVFHVITSMTNDQYAQHLRTKNRIEVFGPTVLEKYVYLDCGADKDEALMKYADTGCWWIEDKVENANCGWGFGLNPLLMGHDHNRGFKDVDIPRVESWKEIYDIITK